MVPVACDDDGLDPDAVAARGRRARRAGALHDPDLPEPDRPHAAARAPAGAGRGRRAAAACGCVEDDPYGELRYRGEPLPSLATLAGAEDRTLALSTLSKVAAPGLRIGWVRRAGALRRPLVVAKQAADLHSSTVDQAAAARWLATVDLDAHIAVLRAEYGRAPRRAARRPGRRAPAGLDAQPPGRRHVRLGAAARRLGRRARCSRARSSATSRSCPAIRSSPGEPDRATLRLSFTTHPPAEIAEGLARLRRAWQ